MVKKLLFYKLLKHQQDLIYIWRHFEGLVFLFTGILECKGAFGKRILRFPDARLRLKIGRAHV